MPGAGLVVFHEPGRTSYAAVKQRYMPKLSSLKALIGFRLLLLNRQAAVSSCKLGRCLNLILTEQRTTATATSSNSKQLSRSVGSSVGLGASRAQSPDRMSAQIRLICQTTVPNNQRPKPETYMLRLAPEPGRR